MSDREVSNKEIDDKLNEIIEYVDEQIDENLPKIIRLFAKLIFNIRYDLDEFKIEIVDFLKKLKIEEGKTEPEELKMGPEDLKTIDSNLEDCLRDPSRYT